MTEALYRVDGMHCGSCVERLRDALTDLVETVEVSLNPPLIKATGGAAQDVKAMSSAVRNAGDYVLRPMVSTFDTLDQTGDQTDDSGFKAYFPLILVIGFISAGTLLLAGRAETPTAHMIMADFMGLFFVVFAFFKLLNIPGFAQAYSSYDLLAQRWYGWGFVYPFIELGLGVAYLTRFELTAVNAVTAIVMTFGALGVLRALRRRSKIQCACLGTVFNLPMTKVTLIEDLSMAVMAAIMLV